MIVLLRVPRSVIVARDRAVRVVNVCPASTGGGPRRYTDVVTDIDSLKERISRGIQADGGDGLRGAYGIRRRIARQNLAQQYLRSMLQGIGLGTVVHDVHNVGGGVCTDPWLKLVR